MKITTRRVVVAAAALAATGTLLATSVLAQGRQNRAVDEIQTQSLMVDGRAVETDVRPRNRNGTIMVPIRFMAEYLGARVDWLPESKSVRILREKPSREIVMQVGSHEAQMNGAARTLEQAPIIHQDRTLIPLKAVANFLNASVIYNPQTRTVFVKTNAPTGRPTVDVVGGP